MAVGGYSLHTLAVKNNGPTEASTKKMEARPNLEQLADWDSLNWLIYLPAHCPIAIAKWSGSHLWKTELLNCFITVGCRVQTSTPSQGHLLAFSLHFFLLS